MGDDKYEHDLLRGDWSPDLTAWQKTKDPPYFRMLDAGDHFEPDVILPSYFGDVLRTPPPGVKNEPSSAKTAADLVPPYTSTDPTVKAEPQHSALRWSVAQDLFRSVDTSRESTRIKFKTRTLLVNEVLQEWHGVASCLVRENVPLL